MKKLLLSTALTGALITTSAIAQTTVTGNMTVGLRSAAEVGAAGASSTASKRGMLVETQLNVQSKGKLNNGLDYAAGFALEFDGDQTASATGAKSINNENTYVDLISGGTTFSVSIDHMNDLDRSMAPKVGEHGASTGASGGSNTATMIMADAINTASAFGVHVRQAVPNLGQITLSYIPTASCTSTDLQGCGGSDTSVAEGNEGSAYSAILEFANLGIKGLTAEVGYMEQQKKIGSTTSPSRDAQFVTAGVAYTTGPITVGYNRKEFENGTATAETKTQNDLGVSYTVGNISYGAYYQKVDSNIATKVDETYKAVAIGYNLGPVAAMINVGKTSDLGGTAGADQDTITLKLRTSF